jgi:hypothetical protein
LSREGGGKKPRDRWRTLSEGLCWSQLADSLRMEHYFAVRWAWTSACATVVAACGLSTAGQQLVLDKSLGGGANDGGGGDDGQGVGSNDSGFSFLEDVAAYEGDNGSIGVADSTPGACDFSGTWGSRLVVNVSWTPQGLTGIILSPGSGTITQWLLSTRTLNGNTPDESAVVCGIDLPDFDGTAIAGGEVYGIRFPNALFDGSHIPAFAIHGTFSGSSPGSTYNTSAAAVLLGLTLGNPTTSPWPSTISTQVDMDHDGAPGVTADSLQTGGYTYPPVDIFKTNRADQLYLAIRQVTQLSATATDCDHLKGTVSIPTLSDPSSGTSKPAIDSHVIGCRISGTGMPCDSTQWSFVDNTQPVFAPSGTTSFTSLRLPAAATCATVRGMLQ